jgi:hypothetical protein
MIFYLIKQFDRFLDTFWAYTLAYLFWPIGWVIEKLRDR